MAFGALTVLVLIVTGLGLRSLGTANDRFSNHIAGAAERESLATDVRGMADRRAIAVRDMVLVSKAADREAAKTMAVKGHEELTASLKALKEAVAHGTDATERDRALVEKIDKVEAQYGPIAVAIVELAAAGRNEDAIQKMNAECRPLLAALLAATREYIGYSKEQSRLDVQEAGTSYATQRATMLALSVFAVTAAAVLGWFITRRLVRSLGAEPADLGNAAQRVAEGDLSTVRGADRAPAGSVLASMGRMQQQLVALITQVRTSSESIATASAQIAQGNGDLSSRTEEQASALEETAASMEELSSTVGQNAANAREANQLAQSASAVAVKGGDVVGQVVETMKGINDSSRKIADIIGVIDGIAFQTNILALNAAVEAARAGEQGRGFAVVASEVRNLAGRSAEAAKEIKHLIGASVERVEQGTTLVDQAGATMSEVVDAIQRVTAIMGEISAASAEQSAGVSQVGEAVTQMDKATQQNAALVEESAAAAESMKVQAQQLVEAVAAFKLARRSGDIANAF
ncbi:methyl-accepting chemotaxis protein [Pelomonas sp. Root1444]|uniref:Methyl-accepting chemotaxis protein-1 (Serine sensor receptor) n=1 Tax=Pelomonas aquatica TaxID=431058 RepID=A0ABU1ZDN6_9BURK|nr:methyl-accepting chemotaxis protein-1 (serine sensor receptor) [Pelomonas aquatica]